MCEVGFIYSGIVQMCTPCPGTLNRRAGTISTPLYTFSVEQPNTGAKFLPILYSNKFPLLEENQEN